MFLSQADCVALDKLLNVSELQLFTNKRKTAIWASLGSWEDKNGRDATLGVPWPCASPRVAQQFLPPSLSRDEIRPTDSALPPSAFPRSLHSSSNAPVLTLLFLLQAHSLPVRCWLLTGALHLVNVVMKALMAPLAPGEGTFTK